MKHSKKITAIAFTSLIGTVVLVVLMAYRSESLLPKTTAIISLENAFPNLSFTRPVEFTHARDGSNRVFVLEQEGRIRVFENSASTKSAGVYLDIKNKVSSEGEMGLLGLAFHPDFKQNGYFYVNYTKRKPLETIIARYKAASSGAVVADPSSEMVLMKISQPYDNHNGGKLAFGPDGYLYISLGDGGAWGDQHNYAQNRSSLLGKILRIDVNQADKGHYGIPADNPYVGNNDGFREEIYAYGLRNPWRFSFDSQGRLWAGDVGQNEFEEIDIVTKGGNYGWRLKEANRCYNPRNDCDKGNLTDPIHQYPRSDGVSVTGGYVYRGKRAPFLKGKYIFADYSNGHIWALTTEGSQKTGNQLLTDEGGSVSAFGEDANGELYILDHYSGKIKRFTPQN
ncbi:MAG: PQQ-dependent sugar dehydrogenase [Spirosomataceae bacterium]